jgi:23S rRNA (cytosine1962-C5)-methyltransferase
MWSEHELIDSGDGRKLERFGTYIVDRPDPQIIWKKDFPEAWERADAVYEGDWNTKNPVPNPWTLSWNNIRFSARLTPFKHTGIFPEQAWQWEVIKSKLNNQKSKVLNLFGYTGISALVAADAGAEVTYVDASKAALSWARGNQVLSGLEDKPIRWILDDVNKFVAREVRRGNKYDCLIMDPPAFGHGPDGETWQFNKSFPELLDNCRQILSDNPNLILINAYAVTTSALTLGNILQDLITNKLGRVSTGELTLNTSNSSKVLSTGIWGSWLKQ